MLRSKQQTSLSGSPETSRGAKTIFLVAESGPDFIRLAPLYHALGCRMESYRTLIVRTDLNSEDENLDDFFDHLQLPKSDVCLITGPGLSRSKTGEAFIEAERALNELGPDLVIVFGDGDPAMAATIAAARLRIPVAHIDAGLRSSDWSMPREMNRAVMDRISALLFTMCEEANINLLREGAAEESIHFVGNILVDALCGLLQDSDDLSILSDLDLEKAGYSLVTLHEPETIGDVGRVASFMSMMRSLASKRRAVLAIPPRIRERFTELGFSSDIDSLCRDPQIRLVEPIRYPDILRLEKEAAVVITDTGVVQEETTCLGVPCLTIAQNTARPVTITDGTNILIGLNPDRVVSFAAEFHEGALREKRMPVLWDGRAAERVMCVIDRFFSDASSLTAAGAASGVLVNELHPAR